MAGQRGKREGEDARGRGSWGRVKQGEEGGEKELMMRFSSFSFFYAHPNVKYPDRAIRNMLCYVWCWADLVTGSTKCLCGMKLRLTQCGWSCCSTRFDWTLSVSDLVSIKSVPEMGWNVNSVIRKLFFRGFNKSSSLQEISLFQISQAFYN